MGTATFPLQHWNRLPLGILTKTNLVAVVAIVIFISNPAQSGFFSHGGSGGGSHGSGGLTIGLFTTNEIHLGKGISVKLPTVTLRPLTIKKRTAPQIHVINTVAHPVYMHKPTKKDFFPVHANGGYSKVLKHALSIPPPQGYGSFWGYYGPGYYQGEWW